ncbi:MAG: hypothetical protein GXP25_21475 [Planctomycetes bacterium]|nr:hypothetical protein [Planctomycetota bacterium]
MYGQIRSWCVGFNPPQDQPKGQRVTMLARITFGCGEYEIETVLFQKPHKEWFGYNGKIPKLEEHRDRGWTVDPNKSSARWIPPQGWSGER